jgi:hypothetical protein
MGIFLIAPQSYAGGARAEAKKVRGATSLENSLDSDGMSYAIILPAALREASAIPPFA